MHGKITRGGKAKTLDGWGRRPGRGEEQREAAAGADRKAPGRKDTHRWCKGKPGREHKRAIALHLPYPNRRCGWRSWGKLVAVGPAPPKGSPVPSRWKRAAEWVPKGTRWVCYHEWQCQECGKYLGAVTGCPDLKAGEAGP